MPVESFYTGGVLLAAVVAAFAISSLVGMLIARLWVPSRPFGGARDEQGRR